MDRELGDLAGLNRRELLQRAGAVSALGVVGGVALGSAPAQAAEDPSVTFFNGGALPVYDPEDLSYELVAGPVPGAVDGSGLGREEWNTILYYRRAECGNRRRNYAVNEVTTANNGPPRAGTRCLRFEARYNDPSNLQPENAWHSEVVRTPLNGGDITSGRQGLKRFYGFSTYLPSNNWGTNTDKSVIVWQIKNTGVKQPVLYLRIRLNQWEVVRNFTNTSGALQGKFEPIAPIKTNVWTDWVIEAYYRSREDWEANGGSPPYARLWRKTPDMASAQSFYFQGSNCFNDSNLFNFNLGAYVDGWSELFPSQNRVCAPSVPDGQSLNPQTRVLFHDEIRIADSTGSYAAVRPR